jgi:hypothetical protein
LDPSDFITKSQAARSDLARTSAAGALVACRSRQPMKINARLLELM